MLTKTLLCFLLLAITIATINSKRIFVKPQEELKCPLRCNCPTVYQPVCGKSGTTHGNSCLAKCFKDTITKTGECSPKCLKDALIKKKECKIEPFGRTGTRKYCCVWVENNGVKANEICNYKGPATYVFEKSSCKWKKNGTKRQKECCSWTRTRVKGHNQDTNKVCKNVGEEIEVTNKIGCTKRPFGVNGLRKFCCSHKSTCVGKTCRIQKRNCSYRGPVYTQNTIKRCKWSNRSKHIRQVRCCRHISNCKINHKTKAKKCINRAKKCEWVGNKIVSKRVRTCTFKPYGKKGIRRHCCSYLNVCKGKMCSHKKIRCSWQGCTKIQSLKYSCAFVHIKKNTIRKQCCSWRQTTQCKRKRLSHRTCRFFGKPIVTITKNGCKWIATAKNTRIQRCCRHNKQCQGTKCHKTKKCFTKKQ